jgi:hypothetical protein
MSSTQSTIFTTIPQTTLQTTLKTTTLQTTPLLQTTLQTTTLKTISQTTSDTTQTTLRITLPPLSTTQLETTAPDDSIFKLGFIVGMGLMGGFVILVVTFMIVTACQRAYKAKKKRLALIQNDVLKQEDECENNNEDDYTSDACTSEDCSAPLEEIKII